MRSEEAWTGDRAELVVQKPSAEVFRAAAANHWRLGVDGLYTARARPGAVERPPRFADRIGFVRRGRMGAAGRLTAQNGGCRLGQWFMRWPLGPEQRGILTELSDPDHATEGDKCYVLRRRTAKATALGYLAPLPLELRAGAPAEPITFSIADVRPCPGSCPAILQRHFLPL
jgi:hypothetical protein